MEPWIPESAFIMVDDHNPEHTESKPLTTELETLAPEATAAHAELSSESTSTQQHETAPETAGHDAQQDAQSGHVATVTAAADESADDDLSYDAADFAAALANFDREQAADAAAAQI
jgi:small subunit ribosomal protein S1